MKKKSFMKGLKKLKRKGLSHKKAYGKMLVRSRNKSYKSNYNGKSRSLKNLGPGSFGWYVKEYQKEGLSKSAAIRRADMYFSDD